MADERAVSETGLSGEEFADLARRFAAVAPLLQAFFPSKDQNAEPPGEGTPIPADAGVGAENASGGSILTSAGVKAENPPDGSIPAGGGFGTEKPPGGAIPTGGGFGAGIPPRGSFQKRSPRENLLISLKPYLSPGRREMADYLIRMCRVYDAFRGIF